MREWLARLWDWFRRDRLDAELAEELRFHRAQLERDARAAGAASDDAPWVARRRLGNATRVREDARERWSLPWLDRVLLDLRYGVRGLRKSPAFTVTVVLTLGLGIGANAAMFGIIDRLMFRPYPYLRDPSGVHRVYLQFNDRGTERTAMGYEYTRYLDFRKWTTTFSQVAAVAGRHLAVGTGDAAREQPVEVVSASFFDFFDAPPALGRYFGASEDKTPVGANVVVLGYEFWKTELGGRNVLGTTLQVNNIPCTIIGVAPEGFVGVDDTHPPAAYIPMTTYAGNQPASGHGGAPEDKVTYFLTYNWGWLDVIVRRKPGVSPEAASADLSAAYVRSWNAERALEPSLTSAKIARPHAVAGSMKSAAGPDPSVEMKTVRWVTGVALIVLIIACANVANLFLARALRRRRETAVRLALGVSRSRLVVQWFIESLLLACLGCAAGIVIANWGGAVLRALFVHDGAPIPVLTDWRTLALAVTLALVAGVATALAPALVAGRGDLAAALKAGVREGTYHRSTIRVGLLVLQGALSVVLLIGAALFVRSLGQVRSFRLGYDPERLVMVTRELRGTAMSDTEQIALGKRLLDAAQAYPGVEHAAWMSSIPFWSTSSTSLAVAGIDSVRRLGRFTYATATTDYFATMGTRIVRGRAFSVEDRAGAPRIAVVSQAMARVLWPGRDAIGQCIRVGGERPDSVPCTTVVGIAEDAVQNSLVGNDRDRRFRYYLPIDQYQPAGGFALLIRTHGDPADLTDAIRRSLQKLMPGQTYLTARPFAEVIDGQRRAWRMGATMFVAFGVLALVVAAVGLYGVIGYNVAQRMHELGVRMALGAQSGDVVRLVVGQGLRFAVAGVAIGSALALAASPLIQPLLFQESARDPMAFVGVCAVLLVVALVASSVPAVRAARADPNAVLRGE